MSNYVTITLIICITVLLFTGMVTYGIVVENVAELPYEQCLDSCRIADKITCTRICSEQFTDTIEFLADKFIPLLEEMVLEGKQND